MFFQKINKENIFFFFEIGNPKFAEVKENKLHTCNGKKIKFT